MRRGKLRGGGYIKEGKEKGKDKRGTEREGEGREGKQEWKLRGLIKSKPLV